jgi:hypothetical protein
MVVTMAHPERIVAGVSQEPTPATRYLLRLMGTGAIDRVGRS